MCNKLTDGERMLKSASFKSSTEDFRVVSLSKLGQSEIGDFSFKFQTDLLLGGVSVLGRPPV